MMRCGLTRFGVVLSVAVMAASQLGAKRNQCAVKGCLRYAPSGIRFCSAHLAVGRECAANAALGAVADAKASSQAESRRLRHPQNGVSANDFKPPLEGLFGHSLGEPIVSGSSTVFEPKLQFRDFVGYSLTPDRTGRKVGCISAFCDFAGDLPAARQEFATVMELLARKYSRKLGKVSSSGNSEVQALGFGADRGEMRQVLQLTLRPVEKDVFRIVISAVAVEPVGKSGVDKVQSEDLKAL